MTSIEIEDVLSSIRRLVSEDLRPKAAAPDSRLILTPALRVVPKDNAEAAQDDAELSRDAELLVDLDSDLATALQDRSDSGAKPEPLSGAADADVAQAVGPPMFLRHINRFNQPTFAAEQDIADTVSTIGAAIPTEGYEAELGDVMAVPEWPESSWVAPDVIDGVEEAELIAQPDPAHSDTAHSDTAHSDTAHSDTADIVAPPEGWAAEAMEYTGKPAGETAADDAAEAAAIAAFAAEDDLAFDDRPAGFADIDEDVLRDIVREIIREELQGSLGERITRNVRKLVRAEINRAMMTQEPD